AGCGSWRSGFQGKGGSGDGADRQRGLDEGRHGAVPVGQSAAARFPLAGTDRGAAAPHAEEGLRFLAAHDAVPSRAVRGGAPDPGAGGSTTVGRRAGAPIERGREGNQNRGLFLMRIRTVKPEFWSHEAMSTLPAETALLALALLTYSDDEGFFNANPRLIQAALFPLRELSRTITVMVQELSSIGYVEVRNLSDGRQIGRVCNFDKHQSVPKAQRSKLKDAFNGVSNDSKNGSEHSSKTTVTLPEDSSKATGGNREQGTGNREQGKEQGIPPTPKGVRRGKGAIVPGEQPEPLRSRLLCLNRIP